jgi:IrrE N-terminal-like domain
MKPRLNRYLSKITSLVSEKDPTRALQLFVEQRRETSEPLEILAKRLGVESIVQERLPFEGGVFRQPNGKLLIKLNASNSFVRRQFTLAHEVGHILLGDMSGRRMACQSDPALERACDCIAAELLMPSKDALPFVRGLGSPGPDKLKIIATRYGVSLHVAAIRVHKDFRLWKCFVGLWEKQTEVKTIWFVGQRRWSKLEPESDSLQLALDSDRPVKTTELWSRGDGSDPVWLDLFHIGGNRVLGLVGFVQ